ncbi:PREDICTED: NEDD4 family-interacting protein 2 [Haliaeetus leucocephalus]|uniref:NEDD4 family-interacting protein 2 n=1 Tax=Haliaeetus leucocephalus TaxID=52644 RepID=UPI00053CE87D|nr:PREDICTED: NEDD4 family-interacting protein 2 [Haliaeetus leucocephalus]
MYASGKRPRMAAHTASRLSSARLGSAQLSTTCGPQAGPGPPTALALPGSTGRSDPRCLRQRQTRWRCPQAGGRRLDRGLSSPEGHRGRGRRPGRQAEEEAASSVPLPQRRLVLHNEDDPPESSGAEQPSTSAETTQAPQTAALSEADTSPPPYCSIAVEAAATSETHNEFYPVPPPYSVATSLPTYDEAEKAKAAAMAAAAAEVAREEEYPPRDDFSDADQLRVGNDGIFMLAFFMAFIFNWIGFCLSFCITNTIAGRYGAICGFGLSLIKWILIVRFSDYFTGYFNGQYWLWWIFLVLGLLLFFRGFVNYLKVRNMSESMAAAHRTRFFFLY